MCGQQLKAGLFCAAPAMEGRGFSTQQSSVYELSLYVFVQDGLLCSKNLKPKCKFFLVLFFIWVAGGWVEDVGGLVDTFFPVSFMFYREAYPWFHSLAMWC